MDHYIFEGGGGGGLGKYKKKIRAQKKSRKKNIVHNKPIEKELWVIFKIIMPPRRRTFRRIFRENVFRSSKKNILQRNVAEKKFLQAIGG